MEHGGFEPPTPCLPEKWFTLHTGLQAPLARCTVRSPLRLGTHVYAAVARISGQFSGQSRPRIVSVECMDGRHLVSCPGLASAMERRLGSHHVAVPIAAAVVMSHCECGMPPGSQTEAAPTGHFAGPYPPSGSVGG